MKMTMRNGAVILLVVAGITLLSGCESSKDKAARHLQAALELVQKGDPDRATVEFRNVFKLDPNNHDARMAFAKLLIERGNRPEAYAQYQHVIDASPTDQEALAAAASLAADMGNWLEAGIRADAKLVLKPDDLNMQAIKTGVDYATAFAAGDLDGRQKAVTAAQALMAKLPDTLLLHRIVIDNLIQKADYPGALAAIDAAMAIFPKEKGLYQQRVTVLATQKDDAGVEAELLKMIKLFPDDAAMGSALLRWYVAHNQIDQAEAYLRSITTPGATTGGDMATRLTLVQFLSQYRSPDAALAEIDKILAEPVAPASADNKAPALSSDFVRTLRASILFDQGKRDEAVKSLQDIVAAAQPSDETRKIKVTLARMLFTTGDAVQARALVEAVLVEDAGQVEALKLKAAWLTQDDATDAAVALLRTALDADPKDAQTMTLMAQAYDRAGNHSLAGDMLSQAVVASGKAPEETIRYADFLMRDAKYLPAESLLVDALRRDPANVPILADMGRLYVLMRDWSRAGGVADRLDELATPVAKAANDGLRPAILAGQQNVGAAIEYLQGLAQGQDAGLNTKAKLIQAYLSNGDADKARAMAEDMLAKAPQDPSVRFIAAAVQAAMGDGAGAATVYRDLVKQDGTRLNVWVALIRQLSQEGNAKDAEAALDDALVKLPKSGDLLLMKAGFLEQRQDPEGAIKIYEQLYAADSSNPVLANNLASMLASYRTDKPSIDRAYLVARRLSGTTQPAFSDTYGWVTYLNGNPQGALPYMEAAAKGLPKDPMVQFHLAEVYRALNRSADAKAQYGMVLTLVPANDARPFVVSSRKEAGAVN